MAANDFIPASPLPAQRRLALVIATSTYDSADYSYLPAPIHDAENLTSMLADPNICGLEVRTLVDRPATEIRLAINEIFNDRDPDDLVLVYLSCHGVKDLTGRLHLVATDTDPATLPATGVAARYLIDLAEDSLSRQKIIILDCCFSGAFDAKAAGLAELIAPSSHADETVSGGLYILTASRGAEYSFQHRQASGDVAGSVFTSALIEGVRTGRADIANRGRITVQDAYRYAYTVVKQYNWHQTPQIHARGAEGAAILLARNPVGIRAGSSDLYELVAALGSPHPALRTAAVRTLGELLHDSNPAKSAAARQNLEKVAGTDGDALAALAQQLLAGSRSTPGLVHDEPRQPRQRTSPRPSPRPRFPTARPSTIERTEDGANLKPLSRPDLFDEDFGHGSSDIDGIDPPALLDEELEGLRTVEDPLGVFSPRRVQPLMDEPSHLVARYLYPTERFRGEWRRHWLPAVLAAAVSGWTSGRALHPIDPDLLRLPPQILGVPTVDVITWVLITVSVLAAWRALSWPYWRFALTNKRIMIVRGMLLRRSLAIPLQGVTNTRSASSPLGAIFNYGTLSFGTGRWRSYRVRHLPSSHLVMLMTMEETFEPAAVEARLGYDDDQPSDDVEP